MKLYWKYTIAAFLGVTLMAFDFELFLVSIPGIMGIFHFTLNEINLINDIAFAVAAFAALSIGAASDRFGRRLMFILTIAAYAIGSFFTALAGGLLAYIGARSVTNVGVGADEGLGITLAAETTPPKVRGYMMMIVSFGFPVGQALGAAVVYLFLRASIYLPYVFFIGVIPGLLILYVRKGLPETERFSDLKKGVREKLKGEKVETKYEAKVNDAVKNPFVQMFGKDLRRKSGLMAIYTPVVAGSVAISLIALPIYYTTVKDLTFTSTVLFEFISFALAAVGYAIVAIVGNRIGRRNIIAVFLVFTIISLIGIIKSTNPTDVLIFNVLFILFLFSQWAAWPFYLNEMFPTRVRGTSSNFGFAFQWIGNIIFPTTILTLIGDYGWGWTNALLAVMIIPLAICILVTIALPADKPTAVLEANAT